MIRSLYTFLIAFFVLFGCDKVEKKVPIISSKLNKHENIKQLESFILFNHLNQKIYLNDFKGKIQLVNFFFTSCPTICPEMEKELEFIVDSNKDKEIVFLSITIDPKHDNIFVLNKHANTKNIETKNWFFLRASQQDLENIAKLYLSQINQDEDEVFYHTSRAVLLDENLNIRGLYELLNPQEIELLEEDISLLLRELPKNKT